MHAVFKSIAVQMQCCCIRLYTLLLEMFLMRDERHKKGRRAVKKVEWRHSKKSIRVKNGAAFCAGVCVCGGGVMCVFERPEEELMSL